jgi:hypothetical protein
MVSMVNWPPFDIASLALTARFIITCSICPGSAFTRPKDGSPQMSRSMSSPIIRRRSLEILLTTALRSSIFGSNTCCRLKASSCRVSSAARWPASSICSIPLRSGLSNPISPNNMAL